MVSVNIVAAKLSLNPCVSRLTRASRYLVFATRISMLLLLLLPLLLLLQCHGTGRWLEHGLNGEHAAAMHMTP